MSNLKEALFKKYKETHPDATKTSPAFQAFIKNMESTSKIMKKRSKSPKRSVKRRSKSRKSPKRSKSPKRRSVKRRSKSRSPHKVKSRKSPKRSCSPKVRNECARKSRVCNPLTGNCILPQTAANAGLKLDSRRMPRKSRVHVEKASVPVIPQYTPPVVSPKATSKALVPVQSPNISELAQSIAKKNANRETVKKPLAIEGPKVMNLPTEQITAIVPFSQSDANKVLQNVDNEIQQAVGVNPQVTDPKVALAITAVPDEIRQYIIHGVSPNLQGVMDMSFSNDPNALLLQMQYLLLNVAQTIKSEETLKDVAEENDNEEFFDAVEESQEQLIGAALNAEQAVENLQDSIQTGQAVEENVSTVRMIGNALVNVVKETAKQVVAPGVIMTLLTYGTLALSNALTQGTAGPIPVTSGNVTMAEEPYGLIGMGFRSKSKHGKRSKTRRSKSKHIKRSKTRRSKSKSRRSRK